MSENNYRPKVGQKIFMSFGNDEPFLTTVLGYHNDERFTGEQFTYIRREGRKDFSSLKNATFYPDAPLETKYIYTLVLAESEFMGQTEETNLAYFFDPESAFAYLDAVESGEVKPRYTTHAEFQEYSIRIERAARPTLS
ncbi:hypothetical protein [Vibrio parahaemolyticus]|uniref:hypothetical protein n=1 Tax=Vibrio parahaemolyticus TaxID=670 RepID=UPI003D813B63